MSITELPTNSSCLVVVLTGEDNFWVCEVCSKKPLQPQWKSTKCFWCYPYDGDIQPLSSWSGFDPTDSVFTIDHSAFSSVSRYATLLIDLTVRKCKINNEIFGFISSEEMKRAREAYKAFLKREAMAEQERKEATQSAKQTDESTESAPLSPRAPEAPKAPQSVRVKETVSNKKSESKRSDEVVPKFFGTKTVKRGDHCSTEAFHWSSYYIAQSGEKAYVCAVPSSVKYGFCVNRVTFGKTAVYILPETSFNSSETLSVDDENVFKVTGSSVITGTEGERILVLAAPDISRPTKNKVERVSNKKKSRKIEEVSESESETESDSDSEEEELRNKKRVRVKAETKNTEKKKRVESDRSSASLRVKNSGNLALVGFNKWSDVEGPLTPLGEISSKHRFDAGATGASIHTTVFDDGVAVSYFTATAQKFASLEKEKEKRVKKNENVIGGNTPADADMRSLLENVQFAKELVKK